MKERVEDRNINIMHLFWATCLKWRSILAVGIICALLAGGYSYYKSAKTAAAAREAEENPVTTQDLEETTELSAAGKVYLEYLKQYEEQHYYNMNSLLMRLNPNGFWKGEISYAIDNHFSVEYPVIDKGNNIDSIVAAYLGTLNREDILNEAGTILNLEGGDWAFAAEAIDANNTYGALNTIGTDLDAGIFTVSVYGNDQKSCEMVLDLLQKNIESEKGKVVKTYGDHDLLLSEKNTFRASDNKLLTMQKDLTDRMRDCSDRMSTLEKSLSGEDMAYVAAYQNELANEAGKGEISDGLGEAAGTKGSLSEVNPGKITVSKKIVAVGLVGGVFLAFVLYALQYILSDRLRLEDDVNELFGVSSLGIIALEKKRNGGVDGFLTSLLLHGKRLFERQEALGMAVANIAIMARKTDSKRVYLVGAVYDDKEKEICDSLQNSLKENGVEVESGRCILYDASSLERAAVTGAVVVMARAGMSPVTELAEEMDLCINQKTKLLGILVVD